MALSGAERQKRFRDRLAALARSGVTADMVIEAAQISFLKEEPEDRGFLTWDEYVEWLNKKPNRHNWAQAIPIYDESEPEDVALANEQYGPDAELILKVSAVARAVLNPPPPKPKEPKQKA
jgi:hypothetical protein